MKGGRVKEGVKEEESRKGGRKERIKKEGGEECNIAGTL